MVEKPHRNPSDSREIIIKVNGTVEFNGFTSSEDLMAFIDDKAPCYLSKLSKLLRNNPDAAEFVVGHGALKKERRVETIEQETIDKACIYGGDTFKGFIHRMFTGCCECRTRMYCMQLVIGDMALAKIVLRLILFVNKHHRIKQLMIWLLCPSERQILRILRSRTCYKKVIGGM